HVPMATHVTGASNATASATVPQGLLYRPTMAILAPLTCAIRSLEQWCTRPYPQAAHAQMAILAMAWRRAARRASVWPERRWQRTMATHAPSTRALQRPGLLRT